MYTAIVLDEQSQNSLRQRVIAAGLNVNVWELICHHMTVNMGKFDENLNDGNLKGRQFTLACSNYAFNDKVVALKVDESYLPIGSVNRVKHITLAVNRGNGGKPFMSNELTNWQPFPGGPITVKGILQEVK